MKRFKSFNRTLESIFGGLKGATSNSKHKVYTCGGEIPAHLRKNKKVKLK